MAIDPTGSFAYVVNANSDNVSAYKINATSGALTPVAGSPFGAGTDPYDVVINPTGKFAYVTNYGENTVSAYKIKSNGALTRVKGSPFGKGTEPIGVAIDPVGKFAYVVNDGCRQRFRLYHKRDERRANAGGGVAVWGGQRIPMA